MENKRFMLLVNDITVNRTMLDEVFCNEFNIIHAASGKEALQLIEEYDGRISVVLLDFLRPEDGFDVLLNMQKNGTLREIPVIVVTDQKKSDTEQRVLEIGAWDCVVKPYNTSVLHNRVGNLIRLKEAAAVRAENILIRELAEKERAAREELRFRAEHDELTGLYNRRKFCEATEAMLKANASTEYILVFFDINNFSIVNDMLGASAGDRILVALARVLHKMIGGLGTYGRLDNDHFVTCYPKELFNAGHYERNARVDCSAFGIDYIIKLNFGIYDIKDIALPVGQMCDRAGLAAHTAAKNYLTPYAFYDDLMLDTILAEQEIANEMEQALAQGQFQIYLQPIGSLFNKKTIGAEVLVRWLHPKKGLLSPPQFIPILEKNGFIIKLDNFVWEQTAKLLVARKKLGLPELPFSVNLSRRSIYSRNFVAELIGLVKKYDLEPRLLRLEVTESAYTDDPEQIKATMTALQKEGFMIFMDDFGSGYSSLNMLKDMPFDTLKIDMKFLEGFDKSSRAGAIVTSVVRMARWLKIPVIAEGVETQEQTDFLYSIGCDQIQGFYFSQPLVVDEFERFVCENPPEIIKQRPAQNDDNYATLLFGGDQIVTKLLDSVFGGLAFFEYSAGRLELIRANEGYYQIFGYTPQTLASVSDNVWKSVSKEEQKAEEAICLQAVRTGQAQSDILRSTTMDGKPLWVERIYRCVSGTEERAMLCIAVNNITDKLFTDQKLAKTTAQLSVIMDNMDNGVAMYDVSGVLNLVSGNDTYYKILGYTKEQFEQEVKEAFDIIYPADRQLLKDYILKAVMTGSTPPHEYRALRRDGAVVWLSSRASFVQWDETDQLLLFVVVTDITEQKMRLLQERREAERLKIISENSGTTVFEWDLLTGEFCCSESFGNFQMGCLPPEQIRIDLGSTNAFHPDDIYELKRFCQATQGGKDRAEATLRAKMTDGSYKWVHITGAFLKDEQGKLLRTIGTVNIVDEEIKAKRELAETADRMRGMLNNAHGGICFFQFNFQTGQPEPVIINDGFCKLFGMTREQIFALHQANLFACVHPADLDGFKAAYDEAIVKMHDFNYTYRALHADGNYIWLSMKATPIFKADGSAEIIVTYIDVSDKMIIQEELRQRVDKLEKLYHDLPLGIGSLLIGGQTETIFVNDHLCELFGYARREFDEYLKKDLSALLSQASSAVAENGLFERILPAHKKNGEQFLLRIWGSSKKTAGGKLVCCALLAEPGIQAQDKLPK